MTGSVLSMNIGRATEAAWADGPDGRSGIDKQPVAGPVALRPEGVEGDFIGNRSVHGGRDKAVYAYAREDARWWERELDRVIPPGGFGENLTTQGIDITDAVIGEQWTVGSALLEVAGPRTPCMTFAGFWDVPDLVRRFTAHGAPGAYLRVLRAGTAGAGDRVEVVHRPEHGVTVGETFRALHNESDLLPRLLLATALPAGTLAKVRRRLALD